MPPVTSVYGDRKNGEIDIAITETNRKMLVLNPFRLHNYVNK